jgi:ADP-ribose pyrophosphatase YjhB (NUDIX family)
VYNLAPYVRFVSLSANRHIQVAFMLRQPILVLLRKYHPADELERQMTTAAIDFIQCHPDCFERSLLKGHITGSAWIVNPERTHTLLIHHVKLNKWLQPGGHCDGDPDVLNVAMKEASEETGLDIEPVSREIFDIDNHSIPQKGDLPEHWHYDIRFLMEAKKEEEILPNNHETLSVRWIELEKVALFNATESILRMLRKTMAYK